MIDSDQTGQRKWVEVVLDWKRNTSSFNNYENSFIRSHASRDYSELSQKQKSFVSSLYDRIVGK